MQTDTTVHVHIFRKDFCLMTVGQVISIMGAALLRFALSLYVLDITGRADMYATLYAISSIPLLISPVGGAIADRFNRRNLMVVFDFSSSAIIFLYYVCLLYGNTSVALTGTVVVLLSLISSLYGPAVTASIPLLVEKNRLEAANGIVNGVQALSCVAAPVIGGIFYGLFGIHTLVFISGTAFFCSAVLEIFIRIPFLKRAHTGAFISVIVADMKEGFRYVLKKPLILKSVILAALLNMFLTPFFVVGCPVILKTAMHSTDTMYGIGMGTVNSATILGALTIGFIAKKMQMKTLYLWLSGIAALIIPISVSVAPPLISAGFYPPYLLFLVCAVPIAMIMTIISIFVITRIQKETPNENLGKVMAIITAVSQCAAPVGQILYGVIFQIFRTQLYVPVLCVGIVMLLLSAAAKGVLKNEAEPC